MHHLEIHTRKQLEEFLSRQEDPDFLAKWIAENDERRDLEVIQTMEVEFEDFCEAIEDERELDDEEIISRAQEIRDELGSPNLNDFRRYILDRELELCSKELSRRRTQELIHEKGRLSSRRTSEPTVEFTVHVIELVKAFKYLHPARSRGKKAQSDFADINARSSEVELVAPGVSLSFPAEITRPGYARAPYLLLERLSKAMKTIRQATVRIAIREGQVKAANLTFTHPDISLRLIGARIADLPIGTPLSDILELPTRFRAEELEDSGLLARVLAAQEEASRLIDRAFKALAPLGIERAALSRFVSEQIEVRAREKK
jgi:hypothetical protein